MDDRSNWARACAELRRVKGAVPAGVIIAIGRSMGVQVAQIVYFGLAFEPIDAYGARVDWLVIRAEIERRG